MKEDRLVAGVLSGIIAGLIQELISLGIKGLGLKVPSFSDFGKIIIMFKCFSGILGFIVGFLGHLTFTGMLGYLFALLVKNTMSKYLLFKSVSWGFFLWFTTLGAGSALRLPLFTVVPPFPALTILVGALIYSVLNGYLLRYFDEKTTLV